VKGPPPTVEELRKAQDYLLSSRLPRSRSSWGTCVVCRRRQAFYWLIGAGYVCGHCRMLAYIEELRSKEIAE